MIKINNLPDNFKNYPYTVARRVDGALWYWDSFKSRFDANEAALAEGGITYQTEMVERGDY